MLTIEKDTIIEDLVREYPKTVRFLMERGVRCLACGEPIWGTIESAARDKGFSPQQIELLLDDLRALVFGDSADGSSQSQEMGQK